MPPSPSTPDASRRRRNAAATLERLLGHATRAFAARGYDGVTLDSVAAAAGVRKATLFHYFASKDALYSSVASAVAGRFAPFLERLAGARPSAASLEAILGELHDLVAAEPDHTVLLVREAIDRRRGVNLRFEPFVELGERYVKAGQRAGVFVRELDARDAIDLVLGSLTLFVLGPDHFLRQGKPLTPEAVLAHRRSVVAFVGRALLVQRPRTSRTRRKT